MGKIFLFLLLCFAMPFGCIMLPLNRKVPISSFVQIYRILQIESCVKNTACEPQELISLGSGTVFKTRVSEIISLCILIRKKEYYVNDRKK